MINCVVRQFSRATKGGVELCRERRRLLGVLRSHEISARAESAFFI